SGHELAVVDDIIERFAVKAQLQSLPHPWVLGEWRVHWFRRFAEAVTIGNVDGDALIAQADDGREHHIWILADFSEVGRSHALKQVQFPGFQVRQSHAGIDDDLEDDLSDEDLVFIPVIRKALQYDAILRHAFLKLKRPRTHRLGAEFFAERLRRLGRDHHAGAISELRQERRKGILERETNGIGINDVDFVERGDIALALRAGQGGMSLQAELGCLGVEIRSVVEFYTLAQGDRQSLAIVSELRQARGELRYNV